MWDENDKNGFYDLLNSNVGQINDANNTNDFGYHIRKLSSDKDNISFLEIGTWNGMGSTRQFVTELLKRNDEYVFYSLECNSDKSKVAQNIYKNLKNIYILNEVIFNEEPSNFYDIFPVCKTDFLYKRWNEIDILNMKKSNLFLSRNDIPLIFDVILLDGGEFTTYFEYQILKDRCKFLLLDDINTDKCKLIVEEIEKNTNDWEILIKNTKNRNGFMICKRTLKLYKENDFITTDKYLNFSKLFSANNIKYYKHDFLFKDGIWRNENVKSCTEKTSNIIISGHSDYSMTDEIAIAIRKETNCKFIFSTNNVSNHKWVYSLPLGLTNNTNDSNLHPIYGNTKILFDIQNYNPKINNKLYVNFSLNTNPQRIEIYNYLSKQQYVTIGKTENTLEGRIQFLKDIRKHIFVACPEGNGYDTHRLWETLYCNRIPIVLRNDIHSEWMLYETLPICWINNWNDINSEFLEREFERLKIRLNKCHKILKIDYWTEKILSKIYKNENNTKNKYIKLFNLDLHTSVIADITDICQKLYKDKIEITNWSISGSNWLFNKENKFVKHINSDTWKNINKDMINNFVNEYRHILEEYDGFIVTHTPVFVLLYESFKKPIIVINSCRYEQPFCWNKNFEMWSYLNDTIKKLQKENLIHIISNNLGDMEHLKLNGINSVHIPSLCNYTNTQHFPTHDKGLLYSNENIICNNEKFDKKCNIGYVSYENLYKYKFFIHFPYEISTMSLFEQYSSGAPLILPTKNFLLKLVKNNYNFYGPYLKNVDKNMIEEYKLKYKLEYNLDLEWWIEKADYYDEDNFKYCYYFDNLNELEKITSSFEDVYKNKRQLFLENRKNNIYNAWKNIFSKCNFINF